MIKHLLIGLSAAALFACQSGSDQIEPSDTAAEAAVDAFRETTSAKAQVSNFKVADDRGRANSPDFDNGSDSLGMFLAYRHVYSLVMPSKSIKTTVEKHMDICRNAGPSNCLITGSNSNNYSEEDVRANLSLRVSPDWIQTFTSSLKADLADVDGHIQNENTSVEDLSRVILDTDARLKSQIILRTRLENLLETRDAELTELLTLERELARVQTQIESATSNLRALRARVSMSTVTLSYTSERVSVIPVTVSPISAAMTDFFKTMSTALAGLIRFLAGLVPWTIFVILPGALFLYFLRIWFRRRGKKIITVETAQTV